MAELFQDPLNRALIFPFAGSVVLALLIRFLGRAEMGRHYAAAAVGAVFIWVCGMVLGIPEFPPRADSSAIAYIVLLGWLIGLGKDYQAAITLRSAFQFLSRIILAMGAVFELPVLIVFLSRIGLVTPAFLMRHFRTAVLVIAVVAAVITPTGDMITMSVFAGPMVLLYLLGVGASWVFKKRDGA